MFVYRLFLTSLQPCDFVPSCDISYTESDLLLNTDLYKLVRLWSAKWVHVCLTESDTLTQFVCVDIGLYK